MTAAAWRGGLRLAGRKQPASESSIVAAPAPPRVLLALQQGPVGSSTVVCVQRGQHVRRGECLAKSPEADGSDLHSPVSGTVIAVEPRETASEAGRDACIVIDNDGRDEPASPTAAIVDYTGLAPAELLRRLRGAGIAGLGGAAFPTSAKLEAAQRRRVSQLVLNGAECEPWICCDDRLMRERAAELVSGAQVMLHAVGAERCTIGIEDDKPEAISAVQAALAAAGDGRFALRVVPAVYPAGAEGLLVAALCGSEVPRHGLPVDVGVLCHNVGTAAAVARYVATGEPLLRRIVTITGSGVARPCNLEAWIGTPLSDLIEFAGGYTDGVERLIVGGGMSGRAVSTDEVPLTKATNCLIAATGADLAAAFGRVERPCIRCGDCADVCPADLLPQQLHRAARVADLELLDRHGLDACIECGCCDHVCPSHIALTPQFHAAKQLLLHAQDEATQATDWRERHRRRLDRDAALDRAAREEFERARGDSGTTGA